MWLKIIGVFSLGPLASRGAGKFLPICCRSEGIEILVGVAIEGDGRGANDAAKIQQGLLIHLIAAEKFSVIAKIPQKPIELPQRAFAGV